MDQRELDKAVEAGRAVSEAIVRLGAADTLGPETTRDMKAALGLIADSLLELCAGLQHVVGVLDRLSVRGTPKLTAPVARADDR